MTLNLADVSEFQGTVNWPAYGAANPAVIVRAAVSYWSTTQNKVVYRADNAWQLNRIGSRANCKVRGFYTYLCAQADPVVAAQQFAATVGPMYPGEIAIVDIEEGAGDQRARRQKFLDTLHASVEWTYSGLYYARAHLPGVPLEWLAAYQGTAPADAHILWQNTDKASYPGIAQPCDSSVFVGNINDLLILAHGTVPGPGPLPPTPKPVNHNTGQATEKPWGALPLPAGDWFGVNDGTSHSHSGKMLADQRGVRQVQREVHAYVDAKFGAATALCTIRFQAAHNLLRDGRVGIHTWAVMTAVD
jgi:hypothetical protein